MRKEKCNLQNYRPTLTSFEKRKIFYPPHPPFDLLMKEELLLQVCLAILSVRCTYKYSMFISLRGKTNMNYTKWGGGLKKTSLYQLPKHNRVR